MKTKIEKNMDDFVYEDAYYDDVLKNNESIDDSNEDLNSDSNDNDDLPVQAIFVCEDCTHQWEGLIASSEDNSFCPLCGSNSVVII